MSITKKEEINDFKFLFESARSMGCSPKYVLSDDCKAIKAAAKSIWPDSKTLDCFFHVKK